MRITLVNTNRYLEPPVIPIGLEYLIAPLELAGHQVGLCDLAFSDDPVADLAAGLDNTHPDIVGLTIRNVDNAMFGNRAFFLDEIAELVRMARECAGVPILIGGTSTLCSVSGLRDFVAADCVIAGPAERALPELLDALERGAELPGVVDGWKAGIIKDIVHHRGRLVDYRPYLEGGNPAGLEFRKGCDWQCGFCIERERPVLKREAAAVVSEARALADAGVQMFFFCDSEVNLDLDDTAGFFRALASADTGLSWSGYFRPTPFDSNIARLAARSGCADLTLSVNSFDLSRNSGTYGSADVRRFVGLCSDEGIKVAVDLLVGYPGEALSSVEGAIKLLSSLECASVAVNEYIRLYENTPVTSLATSRGTRGTLVGDSRNDESMLRPLFFTCIEREWLAERISREGVFLLADSERTVNYLRLTD